LRAFCYVISLEGIDSIHNGLKCEPSEESQETAAHSHPQGVT